MTNQPTPVQGHVTTEKTAKSLKAQQAASIVLVLIGGMIAWSNLGDAQDGKQGIYATIGNGLLIFGLMWMATTKMKIWWNHG